MKYQYYKDDRDHKREYSLKYYLDHSEEKQLYYLANRAKRLAYQRKYRKAHAEQRREYERKVGLVIKVSRALNIPRTKARAMLQVSS